MKKMTLLAAAALSLTAISGCSSESVSTGTESEEATGETPVETPSETPSETVDPLVKDCATFEPIMAQIDNVSGVDGMYDIGLDAASVWPNIEDEDLKQVTKQLADLPMHDGSIESLAQVTESFYDVARAGIAVCGDYFTIDLQNDYTPD